MNSIIDFNDYVSDILDTSQLIQGSQSDLIELLSCPALDVTQVCHLTASTGGASGELVIDDQDAWSDFIAWAVDDQHLVSSEELLTDVLELGCDDSTHNLRAGELAKILIYFALHASSCYSAQGYYAPSVWSASVPCEGSVRPALTGGYAYLAYRDGFTIPIPQVAPHGHFRVSSDGLPPLSWGRYNITYMLGGPRGGRAGADCYCRLTSRHVDHDGSIVTSTQTAFVGTQAKVTGTGYHYIAWYYKAFPYSDGASLGSSQIRVYYGTEGVDASNSNPAYSSMLTFDLMTNLPLKDYTVEFYGERVGLASNVKSTLVTRSDKQTTDTVYTPGAEDQIWYDGQAQITYPYDKSGMTISVVGDSQSTATFSISGTVSIDAIVGYRAQILEVTSTTGSLMVPESMAMAYDPAARVWFDSSGILTVEVTASAGITSTSMVDIEPDATQVMHHAIAEYDRSSIWEHFSDITVEMVQSVLGDNRVINDYYLASQLDYTAMRMVNDVIDDMRRYMSSDDGIINNSWGIEFFADVTLNSSYEYPAEPWMRIKIDDSYVNVSDLYMYPDQPVHYDTARKMLCSDEDCPIHLERFVYDGLSLDEWFAHADSDNSFNDALATAKIESNQQVLLRTVATGVDQSTDWVIDIGATLKGIVEDAREEAMDILQLTPYNVITVPQRRALSGSVASVAIPATYVADMVETAASMGAASADQILNVLDRIPTDNGKTLTSVQDDEASVIISRIIAISSYSDSKLNCTTRRSNVNSSTPYWNTFVSRLGSSIISAGGVDSEVADLGSGANAIFPPLLSATVNVPGADYGMGNSCCILPFESSLAVIYPTIGISGQFTVAWLARYYGGTDLDAIQCIQDSYNELSRVLNSVGQELGYTYTAPEVVDDAFTGSSNWAQLAGMFATMAMGAVAGAQVGIAGGPVGIVAGAGIGACIAAAAANLIQVANPITNTDNLDYTLARLNDDCGTLTVQGESATSDPNTIGTLMASVVMALVQHGAYPPLGQSGGDLVTSNRSALLCSSKPYYRYAVVGSHEDYTPLILTAATMFTAMSAKTSITAFKHPTRDPAFLPVAMIGTGATLAQECTSRAMQRAAARKNATYAMQQDILSAVESLDSTTGQAGVYQDNQGTVTLRDVDNSLSDLRSRVNTIESQVSSQGTSLTY